MMQNVGLLNTPFKILKEPSTILEFIRLNIVMTTKTLKTFER